MISEFQFNGPFLSLASNIGLFAGAVIWGIGCDIWGRRWSFNLTLLIAGIFGLAAGGSGNFVTLASLLAVLGIGVGGNLPVDSAVFLGARVPLLPLYIRADLSSRLRSWLAPVPADGSFHMVVPWPVVRQPRTSCAISSACMRSQLNRSPGL